MCGRLLRGRQDRVKEQRFEWEWGLEKEEGVCVFTGQELREPRGAWEETGRTEFRSPGGGLGLDEGVGLSVWLLNSCCRERRCSSFSAAEP